MTARTFRPDDPELPGYVAQRAHAAPAVSLPPAPFDPRFGDYIAGRQSAPAAEVKMAEQKRATKDETVELPDGRLIQVQAKGAPVDEELAEREREAAKRAKELAEDSDPLREIAAEGVTTRAITTRAITPEKTAVKEK